MASVSDVPRRVSPTYLRDKEYGAVFAVRPSGWAVVDYYTPNATGDDSLRPLGPAGENWSSAYGTEHLAFRNAVGMINLSSMGKIDIFGPGALDFVQYLCANDVNKPVGTLIYTQCLNEAGGMECDLTVARFGEDHFRLVLGTGSAQHDLEWIREHLPKDGSVHLVDMTSAYGCLALVGPEARKVLQKLVKEDVSNEAFPYMRTQEITVGDIKCRAGRMSFVGELGWEIYSPAESTLKLWGLLYEAGQEYGLKLCGYGALETTRMEKGYWAWPLEVAPDVSPTEIGGMRLVRMDKGDFLGKAALQKALETPPKRKLVVVTMANPRAVPAEAAPVRVDGQVVGKVTSGSYGFSVGKAFAYAFLPTEKANPGQKVEVEVAGSWYEGTVADGPLYDPKGTRLKI